MPPMAIESLRLIGARWSLDDAPVAGDRGLTTIHASTSSLASPEASTRCTPSSLGSVELSRMLHTKVLTSIDDTAPVK
jgi:hypothetical protein